MPEHLPEAGDPTLEPAVLILGTAHVVPLRAAIQHHIFEFDPGAVALELDRGRLQGLLAPPEKRDKPGLGYGLIAKFQERVADDLGGEVGDEMLAAREAGMLLGVPVALVDKPADETMRRLFKEMSWWERIKLFGSLVASFLPGTGMQDELQRALDGDPTLVEEVTDRFPTVKRVLIDERDEHMAARTVALASEYGRIVLVVGDAHVPGIHQELASHLEDVHAVRVRDLRAFAPTQAAFQVEVTEPVEE